MNKKLHLDKRVEEELSGKHSSAYHDIDCVEVGPFLAVINTLKLSHEENPEVYRMLLQVLHEFKPHLGSCHIEKTKKYVQILLKRKYPELADYLIGILPTLKDVADKKSRQDESASNSPGNHGHSLHKLKKSEPSDKRITKAEVNSKSSLETSTEKLKFYNYFNPEVKSVLQPKRITQKLPNVKVLNAPYVLHSDDCALPRNSVHCKRSMQLHCNPLGKLLKPSCKRIVASKSVENMNYSEKIQTSDKLSKEYVPTLYTESVATDQQFPTVVSKAAVSSTQGTLNSTINKNERKIMKNNTKMEMLQKQKELLQSRLNYLNKEREGKREYSKILQQQMAVLKKKKEMLSSSLKHGRPLNLMSSFSCLDMLKTLDFLNSDLLPLDSSSHFLTSDLLTLDSSSEDEMLYQSVTNSLYSRNETSENDKAKDKQNHVQIHKEHNVKSLDETKHSPPLKSIDDLMDCSIETESKDSKMLYPCDNNFENLQDGPSCGGEWNGRTDQQSVSEDARIKLEVPDTDFRSTELLPKLNVCTEKEPKEILGGKEGFPNNEKQNNERKELQGTSNTSLGYLQQIVRNTGLAKQSCSTNAAMLSSKPFTAKQEHTSTNKIIFIQPSTKITSPSNLSFQPISTCVTSINTATSILKIQSKSLQPKFVTASATPQDGIPAKDFYNQGSNSENAKSYSGLSDTDEINRNFNNNSTEEIADNSSEVTKFTTDSNYIVNNSESDYSVGFRGSDFKDFNHLILQTSTQQSKETKNSTDQLSIYTDHPLEMIKRQSNETSFEKPRYLGNLLNAQIKSHGSKDPWGIRHLQLKTERVTRGTKNIKMPMNK